ncbi:MAG: hypothetical protein AAF483_16535 [Planctomycetota bacterium]
MIINLGYFLDSGASYVRVQAPAKVNLFLEILGKREDGYHELETLMCPISLCDSLLVENADDGEITIDLDLPTTAVFRKNIADGDDPAWNIPSGPENLVFRAAERLRSILDVKAGARISLTKQTPASAGLGGGSSNAAAALVACCHLWSGWNRAAVTQVANEIGSDIAFFLGDTNSIGLALGTGRGEKCEQIAAQPKLSFLLTHPPSGCSTKDIYQGYQPTSHIRQSEKIVATCKTGQYQMIGAEMFNALQSSASKTTPWIDRQLDLMRSFGYEYVLMSGSGSSCFALQSTSGSPDEDDERIKEFQRVANEQGIGRIFQVDAWFAPSIEHQLASRQ